MQSSPVRQFIRSVRQAIMSPARTFQRRLITVFVSLFLAFIWILVFFSANVLTTQFEHVLADQQFVSTQRFAAELGDNLTVRTESLAKIAANLPGDLESKTLNAFLSDQAPLHALFPAGLLVLGRDGISVAGYPQVIGQSGLFYGDRDYFLNVVASGKAWIGKPVIGRVLQRMILPVAVPIMDADGHLRAVLVGLTDLMMSNFIAAHLDFPMVGSSEVAVFSMRDKIVVASTDVRQLLSAAPAPGANRMIDRFFDGFEGSGIASGADGNEQLFSGKQVPTWNWVVIASLPTTLAFGPVREMQHYLYLMAFMMTLVAIFAIQWMTRRMLEPLGNASNAMRRMTEGKTVLAPLPIESDDEIGAMVRNFNQLVVEMGRQEKALAQSEKRFRMLVESAPDAIFVLVDDRLVYANLAATDLFGAASGDQLLGQSVADRMPGYQMSVIAERERSRDTSKKRPLVKKKYLKMNGSAVDVESISVPFMYEDASGVLVFARDISERIRADQAVRDSDARYRSLFENMLEGFAYCRIIHTQGEVKDLIFLDVNPAFERLTRLKNVIGNKISDVMPGLCQSNDALFALFGRVAMHGTQERIETHIEALGRSYAIAVYGVADAHCIVFFDDISERKDAKELLRKQAEEVRTLVENSPDMIFRFDQHLRCIYVNPAVEAATGLRHDDIIGKTYPVQGAGTQFAAQWSSSITSVFDTKGADTFDFSLPAQGGERYYQALLVPEFGPDGQVLHVVAVARDISVIKQGEAVLRESEQRIYGIAANTPGMLFQCQFNVTSGALAFTYVSEGSMSLLGLTPEQIASTPSAIVLQLVESDREKFYDSLRLSAVAMEMWNWEGATLLIEGEQRWINGRATPRAAPNGDITWEGVMLNISESKRSEQALRQSRQLLRDLSAHMESVREEERKRIAREVHDELGQALTVLRMDVSLLRIHFGAQSPQLMERILAMKAGVDHTIGIMRHVTSALRPVALDLGLIAGIEWLVQEFTRHTEIHCQLKTNVCEEVVIDDSRATALFRIVQESLTNVVKHAAASGVVISVWIEAEQHVCVEIVDDGNGFVSESGRKANSFGLIGMRERALMLQGEVSIDSVPGQGTRVKVRIPLIPQ